MGYKILRKKELCANQYELTIHAPYITKNAQAGQFIILRVSEDGERVPLTIADYNRETGESKCLTKNYFFGPGRFFMPVGRCF